MGQKLTVLGGLDRESCECESSDTPRKSNYTEARHAVEKVRRYSQKCVLQSCARKAIKRKKERKKERKKKETIFEHYISPLHRAGPARPTFTIFGMWGATADVIIRAKF